MPRGLPTIEVQPIGNAAQIAPADGRSLLGALQGWQDQINKQEVDTAVYRASEQGALEGGPAAAVGDSLPVGDETTQAGRAYAKAAENAYLTQFENDWSAARDRLELEHELSPEKFQKASAEYLKGLTTKMDERTRERLVPLVQRDIQKVGGRLAEKAVERQRAADGAEVLTWAEREVEELTRAARAGDVEDALGRDLRLVDRLDTAVAAGQITALQRAAILSRGRTEVAFQTHLGDYDDAVAAGKGVAFVEALKANRPKDLTPEETDKLITHLEALNEKGHEESIKAKSLALRDAAALGLPAGATVKEKVAFIRGQMDPNDPDFATILEHTVSVLNTEDAQAKQDEEQARVARERAERNAYMNEPDAVKRLALRDAMTSAENKQWADAESERVLKRAEPVQDWDKWTELEDLRKTDPKAYADLDPSLYRHVLDDRHYDELLGQQDRELDILVNDAERAEEKRQRLQDRAEGRADRAEAKAGAKAEAAARRAEAERVKKVKHATDLFEDEVKKAAGALKIKMKRSDGTLNPDWVAFREAADDYRRSTEFESDDQAYKAVDRLSTWWAYQRVAPPEARVRGLEAAGVRVSPKTLDLVYKAEQAGIPRADAEEILGAMTRRSAETPTVEGIRHRYLEAQKRLKGVR